MLWSIIILSVKPRYMMLTRLLDILTPQLTKDVELIVGIDDCSTPVWQRRNHLLAASHAKYISYVDDDDQISDNYVSAIANALEADPDSVGFKVKRYTDGVEIGEANHSLEFTAYADSMVDGRLMMQRTPNHLNPVKTNIVRQVGFRDDVMEDVDYAQRLRPLLNNEQYIDDYLYHYYFVSPKYREIAR